MISDEFKQVNLFAPTRLAEPQEGWTPPPPDVIKINVDASVDVDSGEAGYGVVVRDHSGVNKGCAVTRR